MTSVLAPAINDLEAVYNPFTSPFYWPVMSAGSSGVCYLRDALPQIQGFECGQQLGVVVLGFELIHDRL